MAGIYDLNCWALSVLSEIFHMLAVVSVIEFVAPTSIVTTFVLVTA